MTSENIKRRIFGVSGVRIKRQENIWGKFWKKSRIDPFSYLTWGNYRKVIIFFSLKSSSPNRYKVKTHHFYLNQRPCFFSVHKITRSLCWSSNPNQEKNSSYLLFSLLSLCSSQKWIPVPLGLSFTGHSDLALPLSTRQVVLPGLSHQ